MERVSEVNIRVGILLARHKWLLLKRLSEFFKFFCSETTKTHTVIGIMSIFFLKRIQWATNNEIQVTMYLLQLSS